MKQNGSESEHSNQNGNGSVVRYPLPNGSAEAISPHASEATASNTDSTSSAVRPRAVLAAIRRRWIIALFAGLLLGGSAAAVMWYVMPAPYTAFAMLEIQQTRFFWETREDAAFDGDREMENYRRSMMSRIKDPFLINAALRNPEVANSRTLRDEEYKDLWLERELSVTSSGQELIRIALTGEHPTELAVIVNAVVGAFEEQIIEQHGLNRQRRLEELKSEAFDESARLESLRNQMAQLDRQVEATSNEQTTLAMQLKQDLQVQLRTELGELRLQIISKDARLQGLQGDSAEFQTVDFEIPDIVLDSQLLEDPEYVRLFQAVSRQETLVEEYQRRTREDSPARVEAESALVDLQDQLQEYRIEQIPVIRQRLGEGLIPGTENVEFLQQEIAELRTYERSLIEQLDDVKTERKKLAVNLVERAVLQEEYEDLKAKVTTYNDEIFRREVEIERGAYPIAVYREAEPPRLPDEGKRIKLAGLAGFALFVLPAALIVWIELRTQRIDFADEVEGGLRLALIGNIPILPRSVNGAAQGSTSGRKNRVWQSLLTESIDAARTVLLQRAKTDGLKTIMITSATSGEGKTTLSCHLATSLARASRRVLLIDCDVRRPSVHHVFDLERHPGFCEVICEQATLSEAAQATHAEGLFVLSSGRASEYAMQKMTLDGLNDLLEEAQHHFDMIVIDSAPVLQVADTMQLATQVDTVLFSIRRNVTRFSDASAAVQRLEMVGTPILGAVAIGLGLESLYRGNTGYDYRHSQPYAEEPVAT